MGILVVTPTVYMCHIQVFDYVRNLGWTTFLQQGVGYFMIFSCMTGTLIKKLTGLHGFVHPGIAVQNANEYFSLNNIEKDIIEKHMWPLTLRLPRYKEAYVVLMVDKYCAFSETLNLISKKDTNQLKIYETRISK